DEDAEYKQTLTFDISQIGPTVAVPYSPANGRPVGAVGDVPIDIAWVGSCTGGKLEDVAAAAEVVRGRKVAKGVQFIVAAASQRAGGACRRSKRLFDKEWRAQQTTTGG